MRNQPSIAEIAEAAGVHRSTVSRAFSHPEAVKEETRDHVLRIAEAHGYRMSPLAQALRTKSSNLIPLIVPDITNPFFAELAKEMTSAAREQGFQLLLCVTGGDMQLTESYLQSMEALYAPFGVIATYSAFDLERMQRFPFWRKVIVVDRLDDDPEIPTVTVNNVEGIRLAFDHLWNLGHRRIGYVAGISGAHTAIDRRSEYERLAAEQGVRRVILAGDDHQATQAAIEEFLAMPVDERPTGLIAANDVVAFRLLSAFGQAGISVPGDVSLIGFDGLGLGASFNPPLTTVAQPLAELSSSALKLGKALANKETAQHVVLCPSLLIRSSTSEAAS